MDLNQVRTCLILAGLAISSFFPVPTPCHAEDLPPGWSAVRDSIDRFQQLPQGRERTHALYEMLGAIDRRQIRIASDEEADSLVQFLATLLTPAEDKILRHKILKFLTSHPHPAAADSLWGLTRAGAGGSINDDMAAARILADLGDRRVVPWLTKRLVDGSTRAIEPLAVVAGSLDVLQLKSLASSDSLDEAARGRVAAAIPAIEERRRARLIDNFELPVEVRRDLERDGFAFVPSGYNEMFELYEPEFPFVTADVMWHTWMIMMRASRNEMESLILRPRARQMVRGLFDESLSQARLYRYPGSMATVAATNAAFLGVAAILLGEPASLLDSLPDGQRALAIEELERIREASGVQHSGLIGRAVDYSKYPTDETDPRIQWQRAMSFLGRMAFRVDSDIETRRAVLLVAALKARPYVDERRHQIGAILDDLVGPPDDLTVENYMDAAAALVGVPPGDISAKSLRALAADPSKIGTLQATLAKHQRPRIASDAFGPGEGRELGLRLIGQRFTRPIALLQGRMEQGTWPVSGIDLVHALDDANGNDKTAELPPAPSDRYASLAEGLLECSRALLDPIEASAPAFMQGAGWREKQVNTILGSWAELQNLTACYVKDANHYFSASMMKDELHGYVEPVPNFFARLDSLNSRMVSRFDEMKLWDRMDEDVAQPRSAPDPADYRAQTREDELRIRPARRDFEEFSTILRHLELIARNELAGTPQSIDDGFFLKGLYRRLMYLSFNRSNTNVANVSMSVVTTVATEYQSESSLQVAVGKPWYAYVAVPYRNRRVICRGAIYSYYEFLSPMNARFDDAGWRLQTVLPDPADRLPWVARTGAISARRFTTDEIAAMQDSTSRRSFHLRPEGQSFRHDWTWREAHSVGVEDLGLLLSMSENPRVVPAVRLIAMTRMSDFGRDPRVRQEFERIAQNPPPSTGMDDPSLILALRGLGYCGAAAESTLVTADRMVRDWRGWPRDVYQAQIRQSLAMIRKWPAGRNALDVEPVH